MDRTDTTEGEGAEPGITAGREGEVGYEEIFSLKRCFPKGVNSRKRISSSLCI